jgi:hypothetical protein
MVRLTILAVLTFFCIQPAIAAEETKGGQAVFKVDRNVFAAGIHFDGKGKCLAVGGVSLKAWYVAGFPAEIPHFESCTTISSTTTKGEVEIDLSIVDKHGDRLLRVDGVLDLGIDGKASQAIDWDHLKVPEAGTYHFVVKVENKEVARFPMTFKMGKKKRKRG